MRTRRLGSIVGMLRPRLLRRASGVLALSLAAGAAGAIVWSTNGPTGGLIQALAAATGPDKELLHGLLRLEWYLNQSFATLHVGFFSAAIVLYAAAWPEKGLIAAAIQIAGFVIGIGVFAWLVSGTLTLNVHGMGAVVIAQGAWFILAAIGLATRKPATA